MLPGRIRSSLFGNFGKPRIFLVIFFTKECHAQGSRSHVTLLFSELCYDSATEFGSFGSHCQAWPLPSEEQAMTPLQKIA